jgi:2-oxoglutarate dehydrogenase E2 component (dihydrolipoamide succinyltransferase)
VPVDVRIPELGESVSEAVIVRWLKQDGDLVRSDEPLLEIETDKAAMEVVAEAAGRLEIGERPGAHVQARAVVGRITEAVTTDAGMRGPTPAELRQPPATAEPPPRRAVIPGPRRDTPQRPAEPRVDPREAEPAPRVEQPAPLRGRETEQRQERPAAVTPAPTGDGRGQEAESRAGPGDGPRPAGEPDVERVPMSQLRRVIAARLVEAQRTAAILTTFNEVDLGELLALRARHRERFRARHGVDLGLVSLFGRAVVHALRAVPILNARIDGGDIVYYRRVHLGIAVSTPRGLVVPVVGDAGSLSLAELERAIDALSRRAREGRLGPHELRDGTFTITNGGVFGSLLSTPILNPPQSGILGMHKIEQRPVAADGNVVIRPMMYVALSYDHRLVDGEQAVTFLVRVKEALEDPARMVLEV